MSDQEGEFGDYLDDDEDIVDMDEEQDQGHHSSIYSSMPKRSTTQESSFDNKSASKSYPYETMEPEELRSLMTSKLVILKNKFEYANLSEGLFLSFLRKANFILEDAVQDMQDSLCDLLEKGTLGQVSLQPHQNYECMILGEEFPAAQVRHFGCGHTFEEGCMSEYIEEVIMRKGPQSLDTLCPYDGCPFMITPDIVNRCCQNEKARKLFHKFMFDDFVEKASFVVPCIETDCKFYFTASDSLVDPETDKLPSQIAICKCGKCNCLCCRKLGHEPLTCKHFEEWTNSIDKIMDSLNELWKKENSKPCPKCKSNIEKNQGCMHMTCLKCKHQFCWLCLDDWKTHGANTGGFFKCNIYKEEDDTTKKDSHRDVKRLRFYTDRFYQHKKSLEVSQKKYQKVQDMFADKEWIVAQVNEKHFPNSLSFYQDCLKAILKYRSFVSYTYALAYFIKNDGELKLFLHSQYMLEQSLEKLDNFLELNPLQSFYLVNYTRGIYQPKDYASRRQEAMTLLCNLQTQFENAEKEFKTPTFLKAIAIQQKSALSDMEIPKVSAPVSKKAPGRRGPVASSSSALSPNWDCSVCTFYNQNNRRNICSMCRRRGR